MSVQRLVDFCKKFGKLKFKGNSAVCYIDPETVVERLGDFSQELNDLVNEYVKGWFVAVKPESPEIFLEFYNFGKDIALGLDINPNAKEILIAADPEGMMIQGVKGDERGCSIMIDKKLKTVSATCLGILEPQDPTISSVSASAWI